MKQQEMRGPAWATQEEDARGGGGGEGASERMNGTLETRQGPQPPPERDGGVNHDVPFLSIRKRPRAATQGVAKQWAAAGALMGFGKGLGNAFLPVVVVDGPRRRRPPGLLGSAGVARVAAFISRTAGSS